MKNKQQSVTKKRVCPICYELAQIVIIERGDGWEIWRCTSCGGEKHYRIAGRVN